MNIELISSDLEKYSRGRRGAPAKGVGRLRGARVQIPPSPLKVEMLKSLVNQGFQHFSFAKIRGYLVVTLGYNGFHAEW